VYPPEPNQALPGFDVTTHPEGYETFRRAKETGEAALSPPLRLLDGVQGFVLMFPIYRDQAFVGAVVCTFAGSEFFGTLINPGVLARWEEMVLDSGRPLFASAGFKAAGAQDLFVAEGFSLGGRTWEVRTRPRDEVVSARLSSGQAAYWTLGSILAMVTGALAGAGTYRAVGTRLRLRLQGTALHETRERLDGAMRQLLQAEKMTALGELVAGVAHEINNPLASILGYSQLALARDLRPDVRRFLETSCSEAERAGKIVRNLLTFARKQPPEKKYLGLNGIIEKTLELKAYHFRTSMIEAETDLAPDLPMTMLDFHQIQQVLINLLNNAEQAMSGAGRGGTIRIATRRNGERIEARVSDTGPGIPFEVQSRVFEPFFTTKKEGEGTGLGLSMCYGIIQEHGGQIRVESRPGEGATFILDLPIVEKPPVAAEGPSSTRGGASSGLRILVIDDEPSVQRLLVDLLTDSGHRVDTASDVPEALRKIATNGHDLIISDMKMPHGSGRDIHAAVVARWPRLARRIIFTTGDGASAETQRFIRETGNEVLLKPWNIGDLQDAIARAVGQGTVATGTAATGAS
jgi:signal transduction histidine kinase/CheY-like chemotaxis protein